MNGEVRAVAEDLVAPSRLEPVHHRQHHDEEAHPGCNAADTNCANGRNENLAALRNQVPQRDEPFDRAAHFHESGGRYRHQAEHDKGAEDRDDGTP